MIWRHMIREPFSLCHKRHIGRRSNGLRKCRLDIRISVKPKDVVIGDIYYGRLWSQTSKNNSAATFAPMLGILNQKFEFPGTHKISRLEFQADVLTHVYWALALILTLVTSIEKVCRSVKGCKKSFAMKCIVFLWWTCSALYCLYLGCLFLWNT